MSSAAGGIVVVLFTDLVGSTETLTRIGEAANEGLRKIHFTLLRDAIAAHGGTEVKNLGDGVVATFSSVSGALAAATRIQQEADRHNRLADPARLDIRTAVHAGEAVREGDDWFGEPMVVASRLCAAARGGEILVTDVVRTLAGRRAGSALDQRGALTLKGIPEPVEAWSVRWAPAAPEHAVPRALVTEATFVGRSAEADRLVELWGHAVAGLRQAVLVSGEPGIGKTRLSAAAAARVQGEGGRVLYGRCDEDTPAAYQPFLAMLTELLGDTRREPVANATLAALRPLFPHLAPEAGSLPELIEDPDLERHELFEAVVDLLVTASAESPLLVVLDDLHWAARPTVLLLRHLLRSDRMSRSLIVGTYRDTDLDRSHPLAEALGDLRRVPDVHRIALRGLDEVGVAALLEADRGAPLDEAGVALARAIHLQTEGNPLFVTEVVRHLVEAGVIVTEDGRCTSNTLLAEVAIPEGVREVIGRRLSRLSADANTVLGVAAIIGRDFDLDLVERVAGLADDATLDALEEAAARGVVTEEGDAAGRYAFSHALVQEALLAELSSARRARLHARVGEAIETLHERNLLPWLSALARHFAEAARAGQVDKAVTYGLAAYRQALEGLAFEDALELTERCVQVLELEDDPDPVLVFELLLARADATRRLGMLVEGEMVEVAAAAEKLGTAEALAKAATLARWGGGLAATTMPVADGGEIDARLLRSIPERALAMLPDEPTPLRAAVLAAYAYQLALAADPRGREVAQEAFRIGLELKDPDALASISTITAFQNGGADIEEQEEKSATLLAFGDEMGPAVRAVGLYLACFASHGQGQRERLEATIAELLEVTTRSRHVVGRYWATQWRGLLALADGRYGDLPGIDAENQRRLRARSVSVDLAMSAPLLLSAMEQGYHEVLGERLLAATEVNGDLPILHGALAQVDAERGRHEEAAARVRKFVSPGLPAARTDITYGGTLAFFTTAACTVDDTDAVAILAEALDGFGGQIIAVAFAFSAGAADRYRGMAASVLGRHDEAESLLAGALALEEEGLRAPALGARTRYWHAVAAERRGDNDLARERALDARARAEALGSHGVVRLADALLARLG